MRQAMTIGLVLAAVGLSCAAEPPATPATTAASPSPGGAGGLQVAWSFAKPYAMMLSSPVVRGDRVYGAWCISDISRNFGSVFCLDAATGKPVWQVEKEGGEDLHGIFSSPVLTADGKYLVIGSGMEFDEEGTFLFCFEAESGRLHWKRPVPGYHIMGTPAVLSDMVVAGAGAIERNDHVEIKNTGYVFAVRISDGKDLWKFDLVDPESSPAFAPDGTLYIGSGLPLEDKPGTGAAVYALRTATDDELKAKGLPRVIWRAETPWGATGPITLTDDLALVGCGRSWWGFAVLDGEYDQPLAGAVVAIDRASGKVRWKVDTADSVTAAVAVADGKAVCPVGGHPKYSMTDPPKGELLALDLKDGKKLWSAKVSQTQPILAAPAVAGKYVYAVAADGTLAVLNLADGTVVEKHIVNSDAEPAAESMCTSAPLIVGSKLYVGSETGGLRCFSAGKTAP